MDPYYTFRKTGHTPGIRHTKRTLVVATDASAFVLPDMVSYGFVAMNGQFGFAAQALPRTVVGPSQILAAELHGILFATWSIRARPLHVLCDSEAALHLTDHWRIRDFIFPRGYSLQRRDERLSGLELLSLHLARQTKQIQFEWVKGHRGHPLNEAADQLAQLAIELSQALPESEAVTMTRGQLQARGAELHIAYMRKAQVIAKLGITAMRQQLAQARKAQPSTQAAPKKKVVVKNPPTTQPKPAGTIKRSKRT